MWDRVIGDAQAYVPAGTRRAPASSKPSSSKVKKIRAVMQEDSDED